MEETRVPKVHNIKIIEPYDERVRTGQKKFELRKNDRDYQVGDSLRMESYDAENDRLNGYFIIAKIDYIIEGKFGLKEGYCCMSITVLEYGF